MLEVLAYAHYLSMEYSKGCSNCFLNQEYLKLVHNHKLAHSSKTQGSYIDCTIQRYEQLIVLYAKILVRFTLLAIVDCDHSFFLFQPLGDLWVKNEMLFEVRSVLLTSSIHNHMLQCRPSLVLNHGPPVINQVMSNLNVLRAEEYARSFTYSRDI